MLPGAPWHCPSCTVAPHLIEYIDLGFDMSDSSIDVDAHWMQRALDLARRGRYGTSPNPMVGAVVLDPRGALAGEGYHAAYGEAHAEGNVRSGSAAPTVPSMRFDQMARFVSCLLRR